MCVQVCEEHQPLYQAWGMMEWKEGNLDVARDLFQRGVWADPSNRDATRVFQVLTLCSRLCVLRLHAARWPCGLYLSLARCRLGNLWSDTILVVGWTHSLSMLRW